MKQWKQVVLSVIMILCAGAAYGGDFLPTKVYMFGFAASFNDSTVYFTDVQQLEGAWVYEKERSFLVNRDEYSYQLRNFLKQMGLEAPTCVTVYAFDEKEIYKKYLKLRQRYEGKKRKFDLLVRNVPAEVFAYKVVEPGVGRVIIGGGGGRQDGPCHGQGAAQGGEEGTQGGEEIKTPARYGSKLAPTLLQHCRPPRGGLLS